MKAIIYVRVSTEEQTKNLSLETQQKACAEYCKRNGWDIEKVFTEEGESAKTTDRPQLQAMLQYCRQYRGKVGVVVVYNLSRFARNAGDHHAVKLLLSKQGVSLRSVNEPVDDTSTGKFFETVLAAVAQLDNDMRADRTMAGMKMAVQKGRWPFAPVLGYRSTRTESAEPTLAHDIVRAPLMRQAFELYATGYYTKQEVLDKVTAAGLRTVKGNKVSLSTFSRLLGNPLYVGQIAVPGWGQRAKANFAPIVSQVIFDRVQSVMAGRKTNTPATHLRDNPNFPLRGSLRCPCCDKLLTAYFAKGRSKSYGYYACYNKQCGDPFQAGKEKIEVEFENYLEPHKPSPAFLRLLRAQVLDKWNGRRDTLLLGTTIHRQHVEELEKKLTKLEEAYIYDKAIEKDRYALHRANLEEQLTAARIAQHDSEVEEMDIEAALNFAEHVLLNAAKLYGQYDVENKRRFLAVLSPEGWVYVEGEGFRTAASSPVFNILEHTELEKSKMATLTGFEPVLTP